MKDNAVYINGEKLKEDFQTTEIRDAGIAGEELVLGGDEYLYLEITGRRVKIAERRISVQ